MTIKGRFGGEVWDSVLCGTLDRDAGGFKNSRLVDRARRGGRKTRKVRSHGMFPRHDSENREFKGPDYFWSASGRGEAKQQRGEIKLRGLAGKQDREIHSERKKKRGSSDRSLNRGGRSGDNQKGLSDRRE